MTRMLFPALTFGALTLVAGFVHGLHTNRWHASADLDDAVGRLDVVPAEIGDWKGEPEFFDEESLRHAGIMGHRGFKYRNVVNGEVVRMLIVCGRSGPISVHTPDVCYGGAGYQAVGDRQKKTVNSE